MLYRLSGNLSQAMCLADPVDVLRDKSTITMLIGILLQHDKQKQIH